MIARARSRLRFGKEDRATRYFFEWVTGRLLRSCHPLAAEGFARMAAPGAGDLLRSLERRGIRVGPAFVRPRFLAAATYLVGDVIGVGTVGPSGTRSFFGIGSLLHRVVLK